MLIRLDQFAPLEPAPPWIRFGALAQQVGITAHFGATLPDNVQTAFEGALIGLLLDTQVLLCVEADSLRLSTQARRSIATADQTLVSAASIWEAATKARGAKIVADSETQVAAIEGR